MASAAETTNRSDSSGSFEHQRAASAGPELELPLLQAGPLPNQQPRLGLPRNPNAAVEEGDRLHLPAASPRLAQPKEETEEVLRQQLREQKVELGEARRGLAGANEQNRQLRTELEALQRRLSDAGLGWGSGAPQRPGGQRWGTLAWWGDKRAP